MPRRHRSRPRPPARTASMALLACALLVTGLLAACTSSTDGGLVRPTGSGTAGSPGSPASSGRPQPSATPTVPAAAFHDCSSAFNLSALGLPSSVTDNLTFDCAGVKVPLDYSHPSGRTITIAMVRVHDKSVKPIGSLLVNPGGPGASGIETALGLTPQLYKTLLTRFDLIGFDPRGVGSSAPITCTTDKQKDELNAASPNVLTSAGFIAAKKNAALAATACESKYGSSLPYFNTVNTARDMDLVRQAVGDKQLNYLGFSYGTELGAQYLHLFPGRMRVAVLDGAVNPLTSDITSFADQLEGFEKSFDQFAAYCRTNSTCKSIGNPRSAVTALAAKADKAPIPSSTPGETRRATSSLIYTGVLQALYSQSLWPSLGTAIKQAQGGNSAGLLSLADQYNERYNGHYQNISDANLTISCNDSKPGPSDPTIRATAKSWVTRFPLFGRWSAASLFSCQSWQPQRTVPPLPTASSTPRKVLVIGNLNDPATPYQGAKDLTRVLGNAELLTWNGEGHTSYLQGSSCIDNAVNAYLENGALPRAGTICPR